ncbi:MAG TPA: metallophosphoesterase [Bacteroidales bacterium]|nr:metallophosphoesterase [Bacteroidales bacterium]
MKKYRLIIWVILFLQIQACEDLFEYSPYVIDFDEHETNLTQKNINRLLSSDVPDTITIALTGDSHRFYDESEDMVSIINNQFDINFLIHTGDIADYGIPRQYQWGNDVFLKLNAPYFVVVGNHDLVSNGNDSYLEMFGDYNFSFIYGQYKFIFINTNSREYEFNGKVPDILWLDKQVKPSEEFEKAIVVFHTPPFDNDFDSELEEPFVDALFRHENILFATHGHLHSYNFSYPYGDDVPFVNTASTEKKEFVIIKIFNHEFTVDVIRF